MMLLNAYNTCFNSITDGCGSERPTPDIRFLLQDCVLSFILNNSVNSLSNLQIRDSFEILMTSRFQNCPWFSKLIKNWLSYLRSKVWVSETHTLQFLTILTPISNRVKGSLKKNGKCGNFPHYFFLKVWNGPKSPPSLKYTSWNF